MRSPRRVFSREFKDDAVRRLNNGASAAEVAAACGVNPNVLHRWRREARHFGGSAFQGHGINRVEIMPRTRAVVFRLTPEEFSRLQEACNTRGARSISEFARTQVLRGTGQPSLAQLEEKLDQLTLVVQQLAEMVVRA